MKNKMTSAALVTLPALVLTASFQGCLSVKTENEIKPIHITMDINLKVDKELDKSFADENHKKPKGNFVEVKKLLDRQAAGVNALAMLEPRSSATDDDKILIAEENAKRTRRFQEIAKSSGVAIESVQKRYAKKMREHIPEGSGVWYQDDAGKWLQK